MRPASFEEIRSLKLQTLGLPGGPADGVSDVFGGLAENISNALNNLSDLFNGLTGTGNTFLGRKLEDYAGWRWRRGYTG